MEPSSESALLRRVTDTMACAVVVKNTDGRLVMANPAYCALIGRSISEVVDRTEHDLFEPSIANALRENDHSFLANLEAGPLQERVSTKDGLVRQILTSRACLLDAQGRPSLMICTLMPLPENISSSERPSQLEAQREGRLLVLGQLASSLAHQIRNPLGAISNALALLRRQMPASVSEVAKEALSIAQEEVWVANRAISDLLEYSRIGAANPIQSTARRVVELALQNEPVSAKIAVLQQTEEHTVFVDEQQVCDAMVKLIRHACEAANARGTLTFSSRSIETSVEITMTVSGAAAAARATPASVRRAPDPAGAARLGGIALGLTTAHALIANQRGTLHSPETSPQGTLQFRLLLPKGT